MFDLPNELIIRINAIFVKYSEIEQVIIYGSRAIGTFRNGSDIDLTIKGKSFTDQLLSKIYLEIDDLNSPYLFDISIYSTIESPELKDHIKRRGKIFYKKTQTSLVKSQ